GGRRAAVEAGGGGLGAAAAAPGAGRGQRAAGGAAGAAAAVEVSGAAAVVDADAGRARWGGRNHVQGRGERDAAVRGGSPGRGARCPVSARLHGRFSTASWARATRARRSIGRGIG